MKRDERLLSVDLLRIASITIVIFSHYSIFPPLDVGGTTGVVLFFMISGFCMAYSTEGRTGGEFIWARLERLVPEFLICVTITALVEGAWPEISPDRVQFMRDYFYNIGCLPLGNVLCDGVMRIKSGAPINYVLVDGAYWSLLVEFRFYFLLWLLVYVVRVRRPGLMMAALAVVAGLGVTLPLVSRANDFLQYLSFFAFGMAIRDLRDGKRSGYLVGAMAVVSFMSNSMMGTDAPSMPLGIGIHTSYAMCFVVFPFVIWFIGDRKSGSTAARLGLISYPLYLLHQDVGYILIDTTGMFMPVIAAKGLTILAMLIAAFLIQLASRSVVRWLRELRRRRLDLLRN
jgi:peptidoglycan/LPS O-acetylase OafA/YrhL